MADIVVTAAKFGLVDPDSSTLFDGIATETVTKGQPVYQTTSGKFGVADANVANKQQVRGIAIQDAAAGQGITMLVKGPASGFTLTSQSYDDPVFLSDTAGSLADAAGTLEVPVGVVAAMADKDLTKIIYIDIRWGADYA